jgi:DNA polymerase III epsilon subunit-like protein
MEILVLDIECGNIDPKIAFRVSNDVICELGIVKLDLETGSTEVVLDETCKESQMCHPDSWIFQNSSLTHKEVMNSNNLHSIRPTIQEYFNQYPVTAWNQNYDFPRLEHPSRGLKIPVKFWDPMIELTDYIKIPKAGGYGYKWPKLPEAYEFLFGEILPHRHRAADDAMDAAKILFKAVKKWPSLLIEQ